MIYPLLPVYLSRVLGATRRLARHHRRRRRRAQQPAEGALRLLVGSRRPAAADRDRRLRAVVDRAAADRADEHLAAGAGRFARSIGPARAFAARRATRCSRSSPTPSTRGRIFGFHRAMDHAGAIVGPLAGDGLPAVSCPGSYRLLFALTVIPGAIAVAMLVPRRGGRRAARRPADGEADAPRRPIRARRRSDALPRLFPPCSAVASPVFSLGQLRRCVPAAATRPTRSAVRPTCRCSGPASTSSRPRSRRGAVRSRIASAARPPIVAGWASTRWCTSDSRWSTSALAFIAGFSSTASYFALAEGAEKALVADLTPRDRHGTASASTTARSASGALVASVLFGFLYDRFGAPVAFGTGAALAAVARGAAAR